MEQLPEVICFVIPKAARSGKKLSWSVWNIGDMTTVKLLWKPEACCCHHGPFHWRNNDQLCLRVRAYLLLLITKPRWDAHHPARNAAVELSSEEEERTRCKESRCAGNIWHSYLCTARRLQLKSLKLWNEMLTTLRQSRQWLMHTFNLLCTRKLYTIEEPEATEQDTHIVTGFE